MESLLMYRFRIQNLRMVINDRIDQELEHNPNYAQRLIGIRVEINKLLEDELRKIDQEEGQGQKVKNGKKPIDGQAQAEANEVFEVETKGLRGVPDRE